MAALFGIAGTRHKIIVGIDYGTTFSGVSYVTTEKRGFDDIKIISKWDGAQGSSSKTPTRIAYARENPPMLENKWGFEVKPKLISYSWTKLLLDKHAMVGEHDDPALSHIADSGMLQLPAFRDAAGVCEDFLHEVYIYVAEKLRQEMTAVIFDNTAMECWITLPAIWSDEAKNATLAAAKRAGFGNRTGDEVFTIAEPEAAAIATLKNMGPDDLNPVKPNQNILVCDCGGGTVDITTYVITEVSPLAFDELQIGTGGKCGSTYIDRNLHSLMSEWFGASFDDLPFAQKGPGSDFMKNFETKKESFGSSDDRDHMEVGPIKLDLPASERFDADDRKVILTYEDMQTLFDPVITAIESLLTKQFELAKAEKNATIDRVILVGGFAESPYLFDALEQWCWRNGNVELMRPAFPQAAVVRGAALRGLEGLAPRKKYARRHYGIDTSLSFREGVDPESRSYICSLDGRKLCSDRIWWLVAKGDEIMEGDFRSAKFRTEYSPQLRRTLIDRLYSCSLATAPDYIDHPQVEVVGKMVTPVPASFEFGTALKSMVTYTGRSAYKLSYKTQVVLGARGDNLIIKSVVNGAVLSTAEIVFDRS